MSLRRRCAALVALLAACTGSSTTTPDAATDALPDVQGVPVDARDDLGAQDGGADATAPDAAPDVAPVDLGPPPSCTVASSTRHIITQSPGTETVEPGGIVPVRGGYLVAVRQGAPRTGVDAAVPRRDTVDVVAVTPLGFAPDGFVTVYDSTASGTDLSTPTLVPAGDGAMALFTASTGGTASVPFVTRLRGEPLLANGMGAGMGFSLPDRGGGLAAPLPDGTLLVLSPRITDVGDAGVVARTNVFRARPDGTVIDPAGVDIAGIVPISAGSVLMRRSAGGAAAVFRRLTEVEVARFDTRGVIDTRTVVSRGADATRLDDAAVLPDAIVVGWDEPVGTAHNITAAVLDNEAHVLARLVLDRFDAPSSPTVAVSATWGGAAVTWIRGAGDSAVLRGVVLRPDGVMRAPVRDLLPVPGADGRLLALAEDRALTFVARDIVSGRKGLTFGRMCLPE